MFLVHTQSPYSPRLLHDLKFHKMENKIISAQFQTRYADRSSSPAHTAFPRLQRLRS